MRAPAPSGVSVGVPDRRIAGVGVEQLQFANPAAKVIIGRHAQTMFLAIFGAGLRFAGKTTSCLHLQASGTSHCRSSLPNRARSRAGRGNRHPRIRRHPRPARPSCSIRSATGRGAQSRVGWASPSGADSLPMSDLTIARELCPQVCRRVTPYLRQNDCDR